MKFTNGVEQYIFFEIAEKLYVQGFQVTEYWQSLKSHEDLDQAMKAAAKGSFRAAEIFIEVMRLRGDSADIDQEDDDDLDQDHQDFERNLRLVPKDPGDGDVS